MDFGGIMRFTDAGTLYKLRGKIEVNPSNVKADPVVNQDASTSRKMEVVGYRGKVSFEDSLSGSATGAPWDSILKGGKRNMTLFEDSTGVQHQWTGAQFTGDVSIDRMTGEVTGLEILADTYKLTTKAS